MDEILDDLMDDNRPPIDYKDASKNKRFLNHIIDMVLYLFRCCRGCFRFPICCF